MQLILNAEKDTVLSSFVKSILIKAQTVVMYRSTPLQKAEVVKMVRKNLTS
jgi:magnesium-transporting ATPase (P-type)